jgi:hypothetical protein
MERMLLVLKRSPAQELALQKLLDDQQDKASSSYHKWLAPDEFGQRFGPSDQEIQTVAAWLRSHGFQVAQITQGRMVIEFSGTAGQILRAFHTEIHKFTVNGEDHWANASDPQVPAALAPVIEGVASLHNFPKQPMYRLAGKFSSDKKTGRVQVLGPEFTTPDSRCAISGNCYFVGPYDFAIIYNLLPLWNATPAIDGTGQSIAILNESNINIQDVRDFRSLFALPANDPQVLLNGPDPGLVPDVETEADLDVEWSGAVARGATIKLVVTAPTNATAGVDLSAVYAVENSVAPVISESFGECELFLGNAGNSFQNAIRQQAAAQGITYINSSGDEGSARCDPFSGNAPDPATHGLAASGLASSPYGVAVGGTDFQNFGPGFNYGVPSPFWSSTNDPQHKASAVGYIPETTWNSTCTNNVFVILGAGSNAEAACNNPNRVHFVETIGGGGGKSHCTSSDGTNPASCSGGYAKPSWQSAPGVPADGARDIPDVSLFASSGFMDSFYVVCESDQVGNIPCSLNSTSNFLGVGGTSASAPAFAGIMALVNQYTGSSGQGNANYVLYQLASSSTQTSHKCGATSTPESGCIFYDVTSGTNAVPCAKGSPDCNFSTASDTYGVLSGYNAGVGYDLATGLGSVNANNLVHDWIQPTTSSSTSLSLNNGNAVSITHGQSVNFDISVTPSAATGLVSLEGTPTASRSVSMASFPLQNGIASGSTQSLAGGTSYSVKAHYAGNGTYIPSDSNSVTVTVNPEPSKTLLTVPTFDPATGKETGNTPTSVVYGTPLAVRVDVGNATASTSFPPQPTCAPLTCPTGSVTISDSLNGGAPTTLSPAGGFVLNTGGFAEDDSVSLFSGGMHLLTASYPGDNSYVKSSGSYSLTVTPAPMQLSYLSIPGSPPIVGAPVNMYATFNAANSFSGAGPTGTITFYDGATQISGTVTYSNGQPGSTGFPASLTGYVTATFATIGPHQITAKYSGDANYGPTSGSATSASAVYATSVVATANPTTLNLGQSVNMTVTISGASKTPPMTGTFQFSGQYTGLSNPVTPTPGTDANGNQTLTATVTVTPQTSTAIYVYYPGDTNYASAQTAVPVTVNIPDFSLNVPSSPLLITAGQAGSIPITVAPVTNMASSVLVSCAGNLPIGYSCGLSPTTVNLNNGVNGTTTLLIKPNGTVVAATLPRGVNILRASAVLRIPGSARWVSFLASFVALLLFLLPTGYLSGRLRSGFALICIFLFIVGCGSGSSGGGGGPPPPTPMATTIVVKTSAAKVAMQSPVTFTATVTGSNSPTGSANFYLNGSFYGSGNLVGNSAAVTAPIASPGIYILTAQYSGDALNDPSASSGVNEAVTGSTVMDITGQTSTLVHIANVTVTLQ